MSGAITATVVTGAISGYSSYKSAKKSAGAANNATAAQLAMHNDQMELIDHYTNEAKRDERDRKLEYRDLRDETLRRLDDAKASQDDFAVQQLEQQLKGIEDNYKDVIETIDTTKVEEDRLLESGDRSMDTALDSTRKVTDDAISGYGKTVGDAVTDADKAISDQLDARDTAFDENTSGSKGRFDEALTTNEGLDAASLEEGRENVNDLTGNRGLAQSQYEADMLQQKGNVQGLSMGDRPDGLDASESRIESGFRDAESNFRRSNQGQLSDAARLSLSMGKARNLGDNAADSYEGWGDKKRDFTMNKARAVGDMAGDIRSSRNETAERDYSAGEGLRMEDKSDRARYTDARLQRDERDLTRDISQGNQMLDRRTAQEAQDLQNRERFEGTMRDQTIRGNETAFNREADDQRFREGRDLTRSQSYLDRTLDSKNRQYQADMSANTDYINSMAGNQALVDQGGIDAIRTEQAGRDSAYAGMADARNVAMGGNAVASGNMADVYGGIAQANITQAGQHGQSVSDTISKVGDIAGKVDWSKIFGKDKPPTPATPAATTPASVTLPSGREFTVPT